MCATTPTAVHPRLATFAIVLLVALGSLALPVHAQAAETYAFRAETCASSRGSGSSDVNGITYAACGKNIVRLDAAGRRMANVTVGTTTFSSVAPSPDGQYLYVGISGRVYRLDRQANGTYSRNATWTPKPYALNNVNYKPVPRTIKTDEFGNLYISNSGTDPETRTIAPSRILKYAPNGTLMTAFGQHNDEPADPYSFFQNRGVAVSRDGRMLLVTSHLQGQIRRFDLQPNGTYAYAVTIGSLDTDCATAGGLSAVSDVGIDPWNVVYAADTTCRKIKKFTIDGKVLATIGTHPTNKLHEIAVTRRGDVFAGEWDRFYQRAASNPVPGPVPPITRPVIDIAAPVLTKIVLPVTTTTRAVNVAVTGTDNIAIAQARIANEDGNWGAWKVYANPLPHTLSAALSYKAVYVQVRDAAGNESGVVATSTRLVAADEPPVGDPPVDEPPVGDPGAADIVAPNLRSMTVPVVTGSREITVGIDATDAFGVTHMRLANEDGNWGGWAAFRANAPHTLTAAYSIKGVYVQVRDGAGNESVTRYTTLRYMEDAPAPPAPGDPAPVADNVAPVLRGVTLPTKTVQRTITVGIDATDAIGVSQMRLANEDGNWGAWVVFRADAPHTLTAGYSTKGVYVQVRDAAGNESAVRYQMLSYAP